MVKKGLIAGFANLVLGMVLNFGLGVIIPQLAVEYQNSNIFRPWNDPLMTVYFAYPFILGIVAAYLWNLLNSKFTGSKLSRAFQFAKTYFIIATIPGMFISYTSFKLSFLMIFIWTVTGFIEAMVAGLVFTKIK